MSQAMHVTARNFAHEVLQSKQPVLVDFYATWCAPCRMMGPILDRVAGQVAGRAKVVKVDVDEAPELAAQYQVSSIPALVVIHQGKVVSQMVGLTPADKLLKVIDRVAPQSRVMA